MDTISPRQRPQQPRPPGERRRWKNRAVFLTSHTPFANDITNRVNGWNARHGPFAVHRLDMALDARSGLTIPDNALPPVISGGPRVTESALVDLGRIDAVNGWSDMIREIADQWWPRRYFYRWSGEWPSPATAFISASLLFNPQWIAPEWIETWGIVQWPLPVWVRHRDERDRWTIAEHIMVAEVDRRLADGETLGREHFFDIQRRAYTEADRQVTELAQESDRWENVEAFIKVTPGVRLADIQGAMPEVERFSGNYLRELAVRAYNEHGRSKKAAADAIGIDRKAVAKWLEGLPE